MNKALALLSIIFSATLLADPQVDTSTGYCEGTFNDVDITWTNCKTTVQSGAATSVSSSHVLKGTYENGVTTETSDGNPNVSCKILDQNGELFESYSWESSLRVRDSRRHDDLSYVIYELFCHRECPICEAKSLAIDHMHNTCRAYLGDNPDIEASGCRTEIKDGVARAKYGTFIYHRYMHTNDLLPKQSKGQVTSIKRYSADHPGVACKVTDEFGAEHYSIDWSVDVELVGQYYSEWVEDENGVLVEVIGDKHPLDKVSIDITCRI